MTTRIMIAGLFGTMLLAGCSGEDAGETAALSTDAPPAGAEAVLAEVSAALGMEGMNGITWSGTAWTVRNSFRQTLEASPPWNWRNEISNYSRSIDLDAPASRATGETFAQNMFLAPAEAGTYTQNIGAGDTAWSRQLEIWLTPWGFVRGAQNNGAELGSAVLDGTQYRVLSWRSPENQTSPAGLRYTVNGYINDRNLVERVETWVEDPFMGDLRVEAVYGDYRDMGGLMVPATMEQRRGGGGVFGVNVASAAANPADLAERTAMPESAGGPGSGGGGGGGQQAAPADLVEQIDEGVYLVTGGYVALVVEFADHLAVFEAGQSEARGEQILSEVKRALPGKAIRYVVNSHPHSDHTAGLVPFVREGATIVTHANNVDFLDMALSTPRTLLGEETLDPQFMSIEGVGALEDDSMRLELHHIPNMHTDGMLVGYLPAQRILFQADFTLPQPGAEANPFVIDLANYVNETGLDFERYLAVHAARAPQTKADLLATIGVEPQ